MGRTVERNHRKHFNPRSREGSDLKTTGSAPAARHFNPRSREGSDATRPHLTRRWRNFNPRSREGSDFSSNWICSEQEVFQSTLPRRERLSQPTTKKFLLHISIHAPAKGATLPCDYIILHRVFQSTLPRRERRVLWQRGSCSKDFNPRSREGSDVHLRQRFQIVWNFNPRSREGSDTSVLDLLISRLYISIHAPAKGATSGIWTMHWKQRFQSTLPRRERPSRLALVSIPLQISIHAPAKGATAKITKTIPNDFCKINNYNNSFA